LEFSGARSRNSRCARNEPLPRDNKTQITFARKLQIRQNQFCWKANNKENHTNSSKENPLLSMVATHIQNFSRCLYINNVTCTFFTWLDFILEKHYIYFSQLLECTIRSLLAAYDNVHKHVPKNEFFILFISFLKSI
jgi:hypothetical protein